MSTTSEHPNAIAARERAAQLNNIRRAAKEETARAKKELGVRFLIRGTTTFCYTQKHNVLKFATAVCNMSADKFDAYTGKAVALHRYLDGAYVQLRLGNKRSFKRMLNALFFFGDLK